MVRTACAIAILLVGMSYNDPAGAQSSPRPTPPPPWEQGRAFSFVGVVDSIDGNHLTVISDRDMGIWLKTGDKFTFTLTPQTSIKDSDGPLMACAPVTVTFRDVDKIHIAEQIWVRPDPRTSVDNLVSDKTACARRRGSPISREARTATPSSAPREREGVAPDSTRRAGSQTPDQTIGPAGRREVDRASRENIQRAQSYLDQYKQLAKANPEAALAKLNEAMNIYPQFADGYYERGAFYAYRQQYDLAIADFQKAIMYSPSAPGAYNNIARIYYMKGEKAKSFEMLDYSLSKNSRRNFNAFLLRGILFMEMGKKREGEADVDFAERIQKGVKQESASAIADAQRNPPKWTLRYPDLDTKTFNDAVLFELYEEDRKAAYILDRVIAKDPKNADAYLMRAKALYNLKQFAAAQGDVAQAVRLNPRLAEAHRMMGRCLEVWGKGDEAIGQYEEAIKLEPQSAMAYVDRAAATFRFHPNLQGTALQYLDAALKVDPRNPYAWYNRAPYYAANLADPEPNWDFMIHHYSKAIEYKPDFAGAYGSRGVAHLGKYMRTKDPALQAQGQKDITIALRLKPELKATLEAMVDDLQNIPASKAYLKEMVAALFDPTPPTHSSSSSSGAGGGGACSGLGYGGTSACRAGDYYATERYKAGTATGGDKRKYGDY